MNFFFWNPWLWDYMFFYKLIIEKEGKRPREREKKQEGKLCPVILSLISGNFLPPS